jgi:hypothetical protein
MTVIYSEVKSCHTTSDEECTCHHGAGPTNCCHLTGHNSPFKVFPDETDSLCTMPLVSTNLSCFLGHSEFGISRQDDCSALSRGRTHTLVMMVQTTTLRSFWSLLGRGSTDLAAVHHTLRSSTTCVATSHMTVSSVTDIIDHLPYIFLHSIPYFGNIFGLTSC